jgi:hypothetical protein
MDSGSKKDIPIKDSMRSLMSNVQVQIKPVGERKGKTWT